jgi:hypothetical protein
MSPPPPSSALLICATGRKHAQEIPPSPPKRKDKKDGEDKTGDFARVGVEPARNERCADQARTEVSRRQGEPGYTP